MAVTDRDIIDRDAANDVDAIMDIASYNDDVDEVIHVVEDNADAIFTWNYDKGERAKLDKLYEKAKTSQWNASTDLDWSIEVDREKFTEIGVIEFEHLEDTGSEFTDYDLNEGTIGGEVESGQTA